jgi:hypothetical protein
MDGQNPILLSILKFYFIFFLFVIFYIFSCMSLSNYILLNKKIKLKNIL